MPRQHVSSKQQHRSTRKPQRRATHYSVLGVAPAADHAYIHSKFKELALKYHPDKAADAVSAVRAELTRRFQAITEAWAAIKDPKRRAEYDQFLALLGTQCKQCSGAGQFITNGSFRRAQVVIKPCSACDGTGQELQ